MKTKTLLLPLGGLVLVGCAATPAATPSWTYGPTAAPQAAVAAAIVVEVYKSPTCGCCHEWEAYLRANGYTVRSIVTDDVASVKSRLGLPESAWSCHTAIIDDYAVEGHVPVEAIETLLATRPAIDGIALPGMPQGSPGMSGEKEGPFEVVAVTDGTTTAFGTY